MVAHLEDLGDGVAVVTISGDLDASAAPALKEQLFVCLDGGARRLIIDLSDTDFIDSTGLGVLVAGLKHARGRELCVVCPRGEIRRLFGIVGLDRVFPLQWSRAAAVKQPGVPAGVGFSLAGATREIATVAGAR